MLEKLRRIEKETPLSPLQKILLTTDGSVTRVLEAFTGAEVGVETVAQKVVGAPGEAAGLLEIPAGTEVNYRVVKLVSEGRVLAGAVSWTPLSRLEPG